MLLVEDDESVRDLAREALTRGGYRVVEATNGEEGLYLANEGSDTIDLVITDVVMPVMGGAGSWRRRLAARCGWTSSWIYTSGYAVAIQATGRQTLAHGLRVFLQKPFSLVRSAARCA